METARKMCSRVEGTFYDARWKLRLVLLRVGCFFVGHDEVMGNRLNYEDDHCSRCLVSWPEDMVTLPLLLGGLYGWMVERDWRWFERLDLWLFDNYRHLLPHWWSY